MCVCVCTRSRQKEEELERVMQRGYAEQKGVCEGRDLACLFKTKVFALCMHVCVCVFVSVHVGTFLHETWGEKKCLPHISQQK